MTLQDILNHLLNFAAPALALALLLPLAARFLRKKSASPFSWWAQIAVNFAVGLAVQAGGLWWWGHDGKMLTYTALVLAVASSQWVLMRGWRR
jgi:hypothetical protein